MKKIAVISSALCVTAILSIPVCAKFAFKLMQNLFIKFDSSVKIQVLGLYKSNPALIMKYFIKHNHITVGDYIDARGFGQAGCLNLILKYLAEHEVSEDVLFDIQREFIFDL